MARTVRDCEPLLAAMAGVVPPAARRPLRRVAVSPRIADLDPDVADGFDAALEALGAKLGAKRVAPPPPPAALDLGLDFLDVVCSEMLVYHRRFDDRRDALPAVDPRLPRARRAPRHDRRGVRRRADPPGAS